MSELDQGSEEIFLGRQPILDHHHHLYAYELLFRNGRVNAAQVEDDLVASANVISRAFADLGVEQALGPYKGFVNCDATLLLSDVLEALPSDKMVLEILETVEVTPTIVERCKELKARGFTLALDDFVSYEDKFLPLLSLVDIVKVEILPYDPNRLAATTAKLKQWPLRLLAEKVDAQEQADYCHKIGYDYFQGYYFAKPAIVAGRKLGHSQLALMRLIGLVLEDADTAKLEAVLKQEPGLTVNLMRLTNSVATGCRVQVTSLRHAITVLGRRQLQRWLQLLLYSDPSGKSTVGPLMMLAASRGRLMELLAARLQGGVGLEDQAFMTGILSLMPALMGMPLEEILKGISLASNMQSALESGDGVLGALLGLAQALDSGNGVHCHDALQRLPGLDHTMVNADLAAALSWANDIGQQHN
ncbi:MAG: EAL domain-containing protein [Rhodocyclaceae bacterium]|nr:MAG: EAL domain-containing protein [Rhodocyclaceae bacterium]